QVRHAGEMIDDVRGEDLARRVPIVIVNDLLHVTPDDGLVLFGGHGHLLSEHFIVGVDTIRCSISYSIWGFCQAPLPTMPRRGATASLYPGVGTTPSCCISPNRSIWTQFS